MKKITFITAFVLFFFALYDSNAQTSNKVEIGTIDSLQSNILGEQQKVWVYVPDGANQQYPVVYLLDGDAHFYSVMGMIQQLSSINANTMEAGMDIKKVEHDTAVETKHIRSILALQAAFEKNKKNGLHYRSKYYPDDTHGSVPLIAEYDALRFFFDYFPLKFTMKDYTDSTGALADKYRNHFANLSQKMGYSLKPDEMEINYMGYDFLGRKLYKTAERLLKLNVDNYPESQNVYDAYGDYFIAIGDKANATIQFEKALSIKDLPGTRKKLEGVRGK